jgi:hypothetical protein
MLDDCGREMDFCIEMEHERIDDYTEKEIKVKNIEEELQLYKKLSIKWINSNNALVGELMFLKNIILKKDIEEILKKIDEKVPFLEHDSKKTKEYLENSDYVRGWNACKFLFRDFGRKKR